MQGGGGPARPASSGRGRITAHHFIVVVFDFVFVVVVVNILFVFAVVVVKVDALSFFVQSTSKESNLVQVSVEHNK